jgi:flavin reductase (DIM6/NTAB) family NADH-FMN oxidoreductase RutF
MSAEGDHLLVIGEVTGCDVLDDRPPLLFVGGGMHRVGPRLDL